METFRRGRKYTQPQRCQRTNVDHPGGAVVKVPFPPCPSKEDSEMWARRQRYAGA